MEHTFIATVVHGEKVGRTIGFPTANLDFVPDESVLRPGVYFGSCTVTGKKYDCLPYFGPRLIFGEVNNIFEVYIFDFAEEIYGQKMEIHITDFLRSPVKVDSLDALKALLENDKANGQKLRRQEKI